MEGSKELEKILPVKFYSSSLELFTLQIHIALYRLDCRSRIYIRTFLDLDLQHSDRFYRDFFYLNGFTLDIGYMI